MSAKTQSKWGFGDTESCAEHPETSASFPGGEVSSPLPGLKAGESYGLCREAPVGRPFPQAMARLPESDLAAALRRPQAKAG